MCMVSRKAIAREEMIRQCEIVKRMISGYNGILWETKLTGKLEGFFAISTSPTINKRCQQYRTDPKKICSKCYSCAAMEYRKAFLEKLIQNYLNLREILPIEALPTINLRYSRIESHGDVDNVAQCINYFNICRKNPTTQFTLWTKNPDIYAEAIAAGNEKPENLIFVQSSFFLNIVAKPKYDFVDIVFTVFTAEYAIEHNIIIHCGGQKCRDCMECYTPGDPGTVRYINEMVKQEQKKYYKLLAEMYKGVS